MVRGNDAKNKQNEGFTTQGLQIRKKRIIIAL